MVHRDEILNELKEISIPVANIGNNNPYQVPPGYFEALPARIMSGIKEGNNEESFLPWPKPLQNEPFTVPPAYFEGLAESIISRIKAGEVSSHKEELEIISPLLGQLKKSLPFNLPAGYFEEFPNDIMAGVNAIDYVNRELETSSATINDLKDKNVFNVPEGYFSKLPEELLIKAKGQHKGNVFRLMAARKVMRYAVAALLAGAVSISAWIFFRDNQSVRPAADVAGIEKISNEEMENYLDVSSIASADNNTDVNNVASSDLEDEDVKELLADVSDEELQKYLDQHAVAKDLNTN